MSALGRAFDYAIDTGINQTLEHTGVKDKIKDKLYVSVPYGGLLLVAIITIYVIYHSIKDFSHFFSKLAVLIIPILIFCALIYFYKSGFTYHCIVDTVLAFVIMFCIKVREFAHPLFKGPEPTVVVPEEHFTKKALFTKVPQWLFSVTKSDPDPFRALLKVEKEKPILAFIIKLSACAQESFYRAIYNEYPNVANWFTPFARLNVLTNGLIVLLATYILWPTIANTLSYLNVNTFKMVLPWLEDVKYGNGYQILVAIVVSIAVLFLVRFYIYNKACSLFYDEEGNEWKWLSDICVSVQEQATNYRNIYQVLILAVILYYIVHSVARLPFLGKLPVEFVFGLILVFSLIILVLTYGVFKILKQVFFKTGIMKWFLKTIAVSKYEADLETFVYKEKYPFNVALKDESHSYTDRELFFLDVRNLVYTDTSKVEKLEKRFDLMASTTKIGDVLCKIKRKFDKENTPRHVKTLCTFNFEDTYKKESVEYMLNRLWNNSENVKVAIVPLSQYLSFHTLPVAMSATFAYAFTKCYRFMYPERSYKDADMFIETFLIFLIGFYILIYILEAKGVITKMVQYYTYGLCALIILVVAVLTVVRKVRAAI